MLNKGIIIFACRHSLYGRLAYNLCVSIKAVEKDFPVAVVYTEGALAHLSLQQLGLIDHLIPLPDGIPDTCGCKLWVNEITPFEETLLLDADMIWLPNKTPSDLFSEVAAVDFTAVAEGFHITGATEGHDHHPRYFFWAEPVEISEVYELPAERKIYQWRSETIYFKKTDAVDELFKLAREVYLNPRLKTIKAYATGVADELGLNVACAVHDIHPHKYQWHPAYWHMMEGGNYPETQAVYNNHYLATFGSNMANSNSRTFYDRLMKGYCYRLGITHIFPLQSKRDYILERQKI